MLKIKVQLIAVFVLLIIVSCAKRGTITGGDKDIVPPKITFSSPKNLSTNFNQKVIKIYFDEYVKVKDLQKQLIVSPPLKKELTVLPQGGVSKYITIKINDTLQANTTYSFNFGQSIIDNNEGNAYPQLKYTFSTGSLIDSLFLQGTIKDSYEKKTDSFVNVMLYEDNEKYTDSTIYKQTPRYITNTLDSSKTFKLENLKAGKYKLIALKESNSNYKYNPNKDKIAFFEKTITIPDSTVFNLELFKEEVAFKTKKPTQITGNKILLAYEGNAKDLKIKSSYKNQILENVVTPIPQKDSVYIWFKTIKNDSIQLEIENGKYFKKEIVKLGNKKSDTLKFLNNTSVLKISDNVKINASLPLFKWDETKMSLTKKDSSQVAFKLKYDKVNLNLEVEFDKTPDESYTLKIHPKAIEDYLGQVNDSLKFSYSTKSLSDYGNLKLNLQNVKSFPVIVELTDTSGKILTSQYSETNSILEFLLLEPRKYAIRLIYDANKNKIRDTGNYLQKTQPEQVIHFPTEIDIRANWDVDQNFDLSK